MGGLLSALGFRLYLRASYARRAAVRTLSPYMEQTRQRHLHALDAIWRRPYVIGYLSMLITLVALNSVRRRLDRDELGLVQIEAWGQLTHSPDDSIGDDIQLLSAERNDEFIQGCANAMEFWRAYCASRHPYAPRIDRELLGDTHSEALFSNIQFPQDNKINHHGADLSTLWKILFDDFFV